MSIDSISTSSTSGLWQPQSQRRPGGKIGKDFEALSAALNSGDLNAAKTAFSSIQTDFKNRLDKPNDGDADDPSNSATSTTENSSTAQTPKDLLTALAKALESGDLTGAKQALTDFQKLAGKGHHRHHGGFGNGSDTGSSDESQTGNSVTSTSFEALISMTTTTSATAGSNTATTASGLLSSIDPFGLSGQNLDIQA